jgi:hypothetical protein
VRAGLVSDVVLLEEHPARYTADAGRRHRWIRGDWQTRGAPTFRPRCRARRQLHLILSRWKILDNLPQSVPGVGGSLLMGGFAWSTLFYSLIVIGSSPARLFGGRRPGKAARPPDYLHGRSQSQRAGGWLRHIGVCSPYDAFISLDARPRRGTRALHAESLEGKPRDAERHAPPSTGLCRSM